MSETKLAWVTGLGLRRPHWGVVVGPEGWPYSPEMRPNDGTASTIAYSGLKEVKAFLKEHGATEVMFSPAYRGEYTRMTAEEFLSRKRFPSINRGKTFWLKGYEHS